ncbi:MAG: hypothetical protein O7B99_07290 [Planctomycetota bacterium]|nr:hypothetical protein [Planctomycetota bacterium]
MRKHRTLGLALALALFAPLATAQEEDQDPGYTLRVTPASLELEVGETAQLSAEVLDTAGEPVDRNVLFFSRRRRSVKVSREGEVTALRPGEFVIVARTLRIQGTRYSVEIPVTIPFPPLDYLEFTEATDKIHVGTGFRFGAHAVDVKGVDRDDVGVKLASSAPAIASVDSFGNAVALAEGTFNVVAKAEGMEVVHTVFAVANPVRSIELRADSTHVRTGDVVHLTALGLDADGKAVADVPVHYSFVAQPDDDLGSAATGQIEQDGRFVAEKPGYYTIVATCGNAGARLTLRADQRNVQRKIELVGQGEVLDVHTSDLWVWEGVDGRDYCVTGTWGANGEAYFWDVTDPANIERISSVTVDARTVNDVKVSEDGRICVISREGASNRRNGLVIIDVEDPRNPKIIATFDDALTGGVHNIFIWNDHVFALSAGRRYDIINIEDPKNPHRVGQYELETQGHSIHDVWVEDGIAYSSNWRNGVHIVDVGNGIAGGSPENPIHLGDYAYPSGWNHAAFPYKSEKTGKFFVIAGDEAFPHGLHVRNKPTYPRGWMHFIDFTDMQNPKEVARYQVPEAGTHNLWVEDDILYAAYYNGGLRVVDISGELMGDLYEQGREIAWYIPTHHEGVIPNAPMVWGPQPHKGHIFVADWNTGLWAVKLEPVTP